MKKIFLPFILLFFLSQTFVYAQFSRPLSVGIGAGPTINLTDLANVEAQFAGHIDVDGLVTPYISVGLHGEKGKLKGNGYASTFENNYFTINANAKVRIGQFMGQDGNHSYQNLEASTINKIVSNIYVGAGAGLFKNNIKNNIASDYANAVQTGGGEISRELDKFHFVVPINVGVDIPFGRTLYGPQWAINLNYQHSIATDDNLDGVINKRKDHYSYISLGVKYALFQRK